MTSQASVQSGAPLAECWTFPLRASTTSRAGWVLMSLYPLEQLILLGVEVMQEINQENAVRACNFWKKQSPAKEYPQPLLNMLLLLTFTFFTLKVVN